MNGKLKNKNDVNFVITFFEVTLTVFVTFQKLLILILIFI